MDWHARYQRHSRETLELALSDVPGYASWRPHDPGPRAPLDERYAALPALTKRELREHFPAGFIARGRDLEQGLSSGDVEFAQTSGSTSDRVKLVFNSSWWEASERDAWKLNAHALSVADGSHREAVLASPYCVGPGFSPRPLTVAERTIGRHLYVNQKVNPASWTAADIRRMASEINDYAPLALEGDPAYLAAFARRVAGAGIQVHQPLPDLFDLFVPLTHLPAPDLECFQRAPGQLLRFDRNGPCFHGMRSRAPASECRALPGRLSALAAPLRRPRARSHAGHGFQKSLVHGAAL